MISRVADHCFWFGRYLERAESTSRMLAQAASFALDAELPAGQVWRPIVVVSGEEATFGDGSNDGESVQRFLVWDERNGVALARTIGAVRENARSIREVLSGEVWEAINELHLWSTGEAAQVQYAQHRELFYYQVRRSTQLALGLLRSTMLHDEPLDFIWLGVLLERVSQTARVLDVHHHAFTHLYDVPRAEPEVKAVGLRPNGEIVETALWLSLLRALGGSEAYLKRASGRVGSEPVARFLISETQFPRSIAYCVHSAYERLCHIRPRERHELPGGAALERLRVLDAWVAARNGESLAGTAVHDLLTHVVDEAHAICQTLAKELLGGA
jgi:uncharacterized alpha-E superfamily protein